ATKDESAAGNSRQENKLPTGAVDAADVQGAIKLVHYFKSHLHYVAHHMSGGLGDPDARRIVDWIRRKGLTSFRVADIGADLRNFRDNRDALAAALKHLVDAGAIRPKSEATDPSKPGRKPTAAFEVHPELFKVSENTGNTKNDSGNSGNA